MFSKDAGLVDGASSRSGLGGHTSALSQVGSIVGDGRVGGCDWGSLRGVTKKVKNLALRSLGRDSPAVPRWIAAVFGTKSD